MRSSFFGINVAQQGLFSARGNLDVINHNITNSEVTGYTRQYSVQKAARPLRSSHRGMVGTGSELITVDQYRSEYLDLKYRSFHRDVGEYRVKDEFLNQAETIFKEPYAKGLSTYLDKLYAGLKTLTVSPSEQSARTNVLQLLKAFTDAINDTNKKLRMLQDDVNFEVKGLVNRINTYAEQIANVSRQIQDSEIHGHKANDLRDQRNRIVDELSEIVPVSFREEIDGFGQKNFLVDINGVALVHGPIATYLEVRQREYLNNPEDNAGLYDIYWKTGQKMNVTANTFGGSFRGLIELRDGLNNRNFRGVVESTDGAMSLKVKDVVRFDLPKAGKFRVGGMEIEYTSFLADPQTKEVKFQLKNAAPAGINGKTAIMGEETSFRGIPYYIGRMNELSRIYAEKMNAIHQRGKDGLGIPIFVGAGNLVGKVADNPAPTATSVTLYLDEDERLQAKGKLTMHGEDLEYSAVTDAVEVTLPGGVKKMARTFTLANPITLPDSRLKAGVTARVQDLNADNLTINPELMDDIRKLETYYTKEAIGDVSDTALLQDLIVLRQDTRFFDRGTPDNFVQAYMGELGIDKSQADSFHKGGKELMKMVDKQRMSISGVNRDEEIAEMTAYLQVYRYSAKAMEVFDRIYETTINLGR